MRLMASLSVCMLLTGAAFAQQKATTTAHASSKKEVVRKNNVWGTIKNSRNKPIKGVKAFVYGADSTIKASGFTDSAGRYETNNVPDGSYYMKLVYPNRRTAVVAGVDVKKGPVELNVKIDVPEEVDTILGYKQLMPAPEPTTGSKAGGKPVKQ